MSKATMARNKARAYQLGRHQAQVLFNTNEHRKETNACITNPALHIQLIPVRPYLVGMKDWFAEQVQAGFDARMKELEAK